MWSERLYRWLLKLYPEDFHLDYSTDMVHQFREQCRERGAARTWAEAIPDLTLTAWKEHVSLVAQDFVYSVRLLSRNRMLTLVAVLSVALAIGANSAMFSVVYTSVLRPLPYRDSPRLVMLWGTRTDDRGFRTGVAVPDYRDYRQANLEAPARAFEQMELFGGQRWVNLQSDGRADRAVLAYASPGFFEMLGTRQAVGRGFAAEEIARGAKNALISYGYWQRRYGGAADVLGKPIVANGAASQIIGVLPRDFGLWDDSVDIWVPLIVQPGASSTAAGRSVVWQTCVARLRRGATIAQAQAQMNTVTAQLATAYPSTNDKRNVYVDPLSKALRGDLGDNLFPLFLAVAFVLLIACTNVTNLLLARASARGRELALRAAIGAGRRRLMRQLLMDGLVIAIPSGLAGLLAAQAGIRLFKANVPQGFPYLDRMSVDWRVTLFTAGVASGVGLLMGFAPAIQFSRPDLIDALKRGGCGSGGRIQRGRSVLVAGQVALACILVSAAGISIQAIRELYRKQAGFNTDHLLTMHVHLSGERYARRGPARDIDVREVDPRVETFYADLMARVRQMPGVQTASLSSWIPYSITGEGKGDRDFTIEGRETEPGRPGPNAPFYNMVTPGYLSTLEVPLIRGRFFNDRDTENAQWVAVVNQAFAKKFFPDQDVLGQRIVVKTVAEERPRQIVGVIGDMRNFGEIQPELYVSFLQQPAIYPGYGTQPRLGRQLALRINGAGIGIPEAVQRAVRELDALQLVFDVKTMRQRVDENHQGATFISVFLVMFASMALLLAAVGIYGVMSYMVTQRRHVIGIRLALGANRRRVVRMVLMDGLKLAGVGLAVGIAGSFGAGKVLASLIEGAKMNPAALAGTAMVLLGAAVVAAAIPGRRASSVDPVTALRSE